MPLSAIYMQFFLIYRNFSEENIPVIAVGFHKENIYGRKTIFTRLIELFKRFTQHVSCRKKRKRYFTPKRI